MRALLARYSNGETPIERVNLPAAQNAEPANIEQYWSGAPAPEERGAEVRALWTNDALLIRFDCRQKGPLIVSAEPKLDAKTIGLWERDVCEVFLAPEAAGLGIGGWELDKCRYFEFEAAPTGEWLDLAIQQTADGRVTDWEYRSGMTVVTKVGPGRMLIALRIPWEAFGVRPQTGDRWRANFFRCVGSGSERGYLAWQPTLTPTPNFHVPERFGELVFEE